MCEGLGVEKGEVCYARAGDHHIAFREYVGDGVGDQEIVMVNGANFPMDSLLEDPIAHRLLEGLAGLGRLVVFDRRGIALSDPVTDWETPLWEQWAEDLAAVVDAAGCDRPTVFSWCSHPVARASSVQHPDLIGRLALMNPRASLTDADSELRNAMSRGFARMRSGEAGPGANPHRQNDPAYQSWQDAAGRAGASPSLAARMMDKQLRDPPFDNRQVQTPTLIINRRPDVIPGVEVLYRRVVQEIAHAEHVDLGRGDFFPVGAEVDDILAVISQYLTGEVRTPAPERQIFTIVFTDVVGSTRRAISSGDRAWRQLLDHHDDASRFQVTHRGGAVIKTTGDGILALMPSATAAIAAARAIRSELEADGLQVRTGIHIGEVDRRGDDVSGVAVNMAARIMSTAHADQIVVSDVVTRMTDAVAFQPLGPTALKDFDDTWDLFEVT